MRRLVGLDYHQLPAESAADLQAPVACAVQVRVMTPVPVAFVMVKVLPLFDVATMTYESAAADVMFDVRAQTWRRSSTPGRWCRSTCSSRSSARP